MAMQKTAAGNTVSAAEEDKRKNIRYHSLTALYRKEMADHVNSKRFIIIHSDTSVFVGSFRLYCDTLHVFTFYKKRIQGTSNVHTAAGYVNLLAVYEYLII
jgi:hypothetical protein